MRSIRPIGDTEVCPAWSEIRFCGFWIVGLLVDVGLLVGSEPSVIDGPLAGWVFSGFGTFAVLVCVPALVSIMAINFYGAMLTGASAVDGFRPVKPTIRSRVIGIVVVAVIAYIVALLIPDNYLTSFNNFVLLMLYFLIPWTAVNLVDFYFVRHGHYAITEIFKPNGIYGRWSWRGLLAYLVGFAAMIPFLSTTFYVGPAAEAMNGADISFIVGLVVSGGLYLTLCRGLDLDAERAAIVASDRELEQRESAS